MPGKRTFGKTIGWCLCLLLVSGMAMASETRFAFAPSAQASDVELAKSVATLAMRSGPAQ